ncbi:MAG: CBS domain-containing protein [bacterium]
MSTREITAQEIMTSPVITVQSQMTVEEVSDLLSSHMITGAPVLDENERHIGVVTLSDIVRNEPRREHIISDKVASDYVLKAWQPQFSAEELTGYHLEESETLLAKDIMTPFIYRVQEETPVSELAQIMLSGRIHRLFVARDDEIVGVVSVLDMLKMFVNAVK